MSNTNSTPNDGRPEFPDIPTTPPLISVVMPTFNCARYLPESISAVLSQNYPHIELIVVDDGSTDSTSAVVEEFSDRIVYLRQDNFGGPSRPRNLGVSQAKGDFVAFCDSDDVMSPTAMADAMQVFTEFADVDFVWGNFREIDEHGAVLGTNGMDRYQAFREDLQPSVLDKVSLMKPGKIYSRLLQGLFLGISSVVVKKSVLIEVGPFDETLLNSDDREMWFRIARGDYRFAYVDRTQFSYRKHSGSVTNRGYLRLPSVINNLEGQLPYLAPGADLDYVRSRINNCRLGYAWGLQNQGQLQQAKQEYRRALGESWSWSGLTGYVKTILLIAKNLLLMNKE